MQEQISDQQFSHVVAAITKGNYSWACVLFLQFSGYNPALYFPYRTYKRLIKEKNQDKPMKQ
jgi:hypothetical protein